MKIDMKANSLFLTLLAGGVLTLCALFTSCSSEIDEMVNNDIEMVEEGPQTVKMNFNVRKASFDANTSTRSIEDEGWTDQDIVFIEFTRANGEKTNGYAIYDGNTEEWNVSFNLSLARDAETPCKVFYFDGKKGTESVLSATELKISNTTGVYVDSTAHYTYPSNGTLTVDASLTPLTSRIRFKGDSESTDSKYYSLYGIKYVYGFDRETNTILYESFPVDFSIDGNSYSDYIYGVFENESKPALYVNYDEYSFYAECGNNMLVTGKSGWMNIPTTKKHNGWKQSVVEGETNGYKWIDIGLPSGLKWATMNVGATNESEIGNLYYWGATTTTAVTYHSGNIDISGNSTYDAATKNLKSPWRMPTRTECIELINNIKVIDTVSTLLKTYCLLVGPNGKKLPFFCKNFTIDYSYCFYWTSTSYNTDYATVLTIRSNQKPSVSIESKNYDWFGIRPVTN